MPFSERYIAPVVLRCEADFSDGPIAIEALPIFAEMQEEDRLIIAFADTEILFTVIGRARGALHLGCFLTPFEYIHWRLEERHGRMSLSTKDGKRIMALRRFYGMTAG